MWTDFCEIFMIGLVTPQQKEQSITFWDLGLIQISDPELGLLQSEMWNAVT